jgi:glucose/arabinose dehydrogenase
MSTGVTRRSPATRSWRGTWNGAALTDVRDIFVADDVDMEVSRLAFAPDGTLFMTIGGPGTGPSASLDRPRHTNDYAGKVLRMRDDGSVPPDDLFVGKAGYKPYIYSMGHRNRSGWPSTLTTARCGPASRARTVATGST